MIVHSFIHECKGLAAISPAVVSYIVNGRLNTVLEHLVIQDIPDPCLRQILKEVTHSLSQCEDKLEIPQLVIIAHILNSWCAKHLIFLL